MSGVIHVTSLKMARAALIAALTIATIAGLCTLALHPALYPSDATDTGDPT